MSRDTCYNSGTKLAEDSCHTACHDSEGSIKEEHDKVKITAPLEFNVDATHEEISFAEDGRKAPVTEHSFG